jgi:hypothetical protein
MTLEAAAASDFTFSQWVATMRANICRHDGGSLSSAAQVQRCCRERFEPAGGGTDADDGRALPLWLALHHGRVCR